MITVGVTIAETIVPVLALGIGGRIVAILLMEVPVGIDVARVNVSVQTLVVSVGFGIVCLGGMALMVN